MKNIFFLPFFFFFTFSICPAQTRLIDSLKQALRNEEEDTGKVNTLNAISDECCKIAKYDSSMFYASTAIKLADTLGFDKGLGNAHLNMGKYYEKKANYSAALTSFQQGLSIFQKIGNKKGPGNCFVNIGILYFNLGNYPKALDYFFKALSQFQEIGDKSGSALAFHYIGNIYYYQDKDKALEYYFKALNINQKRGDSLDERGDMMDIGLIYNSLKKYDIALNYLYKALRVNKKIGDRQLESNNLEDIGEVYIDSGQYSKALEYEFQSIAIAREIGANNQYAYDLNDIGEIYTKQKKYDLSKKYLDSALCVSKKMGVKDLILNVYNNLTALDSATGNFKAELLDNKNFFVYRDSLNNEKTLQEEMNNEFEKKSDSLKTEQVKKDAVKENEIRNQKRIRNYILGGFSIAIMAAGLFFIQRRRISKEKKRSDELLLNILPAEVAEELKEKGSAEAKMFDEVSVIFTDFKGFTTIAENLSAKELVAEIDYCFKGFDNIIHKYNIEKIKTIGDSYMAAGGLPVASKTHAADVVNAALEIVKFMENHKQQRLREGKPVFEIRIGINTGPVVAGIVGVKKFAYDIWGDTVNLASRMESSGEPGKINISGSTYELVKNDFTCTYRGKIQAKNKGEVDMYFVS